MEKKEERETERRFRNVLLRLAAMVIITAWIAVATYVASENVASEKLLWVAIGVTGATVFLSYLGYDLWELTHYDSPETRQFIKNWITGTVGIVIVITWIALVSYLSLGELVSNAVALSGAVIFTAHFVYNSTIFDRRNWADLQKWRCDFKKRVIESTFIVIATIWATASASVWTNAIAIVLGITGGTIWLSHAIYHGWRLFD